MARIRTIKPEFWTDEKIVQLPFETRLLFIGCWNFADDEGYLPFEPERIRMQILPNDQIDADAHIDLLAAAGLIERHETKDGDGALFLPHFIEHQKISHATPSRIAPEVSGKIAIPLESRRKIATKYGCTPGGDKDAACYVCGMVGRIWWPNNSKGRPGYWVSFSGLEISHFTAEAKGGESTEENLVLCCRTCNRSMGTNNPVSAIIRKLPENMQVIPENTGVLRPELNGIEWKGIEGIHPLPSPEKSRANPNPKTPPEFDSSLDVVWKKIADGLQIIKPKAVRAELTPWRRNAMSELIADGLTADKILSACRWFFTSADERAVNARKVGNIDTVLQPDKCTKYFEFSTDPDAWGKTRDGPEVAAKLKAADEQRRLVQGANRAG